MVARINYTGQSLEGLLSSSAKCYPNIRFDKDGNFIYALIYAQ